MPFFEITMDRACPRSWALVTCAESQKMLAATQQIAI
jgi:hypothetical protein